MLMRVFVSTWNIRFAIIFRTCLYIKRTHYFTNAFASTFYNKTHMIVKGIFIEDQLKPTRRPFCMAFGVSGKPRKIHLTIYYFLFLIAVNIGTPIRIRVVEQTSFYLEFAC